MTPGAFKNNQVEIESANFVIWSYIIKLFGRLEVSNNIFLISESKRKFINPTLLVFCRVSNYVTANT